MVGVIFIEGGRGQRRGGGHTEVSLQCDLPPFLTHMEVVEGAFGVLSVCVGGHHLDVVPIYRYSGEVILDCS